MPPIPGNPDQVNWRPIRDDPSQVNLPPIRHNPDQLKTTLPPIRDYPDSIDTQSSDYSSESSIGEANPEATTDGWPELGAARPSQHEFPDLSLVDDGDYWQYPHINGNDGAH